MCNLCFCQSFVSSLRIQGVVVPLLLAIGSISTAHGQASIPPPIEFRQGFSGAGSALQLNNGAKIGGDTLEMTDGGLDEATSAFATAPVNVQAFTTDFEFGLAGKADGFTFTIQNVGPGAVGGQGGGLGYEGIQKSIAIKFDIYNNAGEGDDSIGLYTDGASPTTPAIDLSNTRITLNGSVFKGHVVYDGTDLTMTFTDINSNVSYTHVWPIDIPGTVGGATAYVGFTGGTGGLGSQNWIFSWSYSDGRPSYPNGFYDYAALHFNGSAKPDLKEAVSYSDVLLTDGGAGEAGSIFYKDPQNIEAFDTDFTFAFLNTSPNGGLAADGLTFTIQNAAAAAAAVGGLGGGLGYEGVPKSVAVKFDLYSNEGEGYNSTGLYTDGAPPTLPALDMGQLNLHTASNGLGLPGDVFDAHLTYDGANLTLTVTDMNMLDNPIPILVDYTHTWPIDIPATVGGTKAYVGFTGATGALTSAASVLTWTYTPEMP
jgi:hypothetical protein